MDKPPDLLPPPPPSTLDVPIVPRSVAIARLIEEVRVGKMTPASSYNRTYSRHNR